MKQRPLTLAALLAAALALTGCVMAPAPEPAAETPDNDSNTQSVVEEAEIEPEEEVEEEPSLSSRGFLPKEVGEVGGLLDGDEPVVEFTLTEIRWDYQCGEYASRSENGSFVGLHFDVEVFPAWADQDYVLPTFSMTEFDFQAFTGDGDRINDVGGSAFMCAETSDELPYDIGPGQSASGWIILDLPEDAEIVAYVLPYEGIGLEWQLH